MLFSTQLFGSVLVRIVSFKLGCESNHHTEDVLAVKAKYSSPHYVIVAALNHKKQLISKVIS